jgi:hypothetical protein
MLWETFYCALVWPRLTRPVCLALAVLVHGGIALFLGMITFGLAMIIGNLAFVSPQTTDFGQAGQGRGRASPAAAQRAHSRGLRRRAPR